MSLACSVVRGSIAVKQDDVIGTHTSLMRIIIGAKLYRICFSEDKQGTINNMISLILIKLAIFDIGKFCIYTLHIDES